MNSRKNNRCRISVGIEKDRYIVSEIKEESEEVVHYTIEDLGVFKGRDILLNLGNDYVSFIFMSSSVTNKKKAEEDILTRARSRVEDSETYDFFIKRSGEIYVVFYIKSNIIASLSLPLTPEYITIYPEVLGPYNYWYHHHHKNKVKHSVIIQMQRRDTVILFMRGRDLCDIKSIPIGLEDYEEASTKLKFPEKNSSQTECDSLKSLKKINLNWMREVKHSLSGFSSSGSFAPQVFLVGFENTIDNLNILLEGYLKLVVHPSIERRHSFSNIGIMGNLFALRGERIKRRKDNRLLFRIKELYSHMKAGRTYPVRPKKTLHSKLRSS